MKGKKVSDLGGLGHLTPLAAAAVLLDQKVLFALRQSLIAGEALHDALNKSDDWVDIAGKTTKWAANMRQLPSDLPERVSAIVGMVEVTIDLYTSMSPPRAKIARKRKSKGKK